MPKINFNTALLNEKSEPVMAARVDHKRTKILPDGRGVPHVELDNDGHAILDTVLVKDILVKILHSSFEGDEKMSFSDRTKRAKLARKIQTNSTANYTKADVELIQEMCARGGSTSLLGQIDDLISGAAHDEKDQAA